MCKNNWKLVWRMLVEKCKHLLVLLLDNWYVFTYWLNEKRKVWCDFLKVWWCDVREELAYRREWRIARKEESEEIFLDKLKEFGLAILVFGIFGIAFCGMLFIVYSEQYLVSWKNEKYISPEYVYPIVDERIEKLNYTLDGKIIIWAKDFEVSRYKNDEVQQLYVINTEDYFTCEWDNGDLKVFLEVAERPDSTQTKTICCTMHIVFD